MNATTAKSLPRGRALLFSVALAVNIVVALLVNQPGYPDAYYYFNGGERLLQGHGFTDPYLWNYLNAPDVLPIPSHTYWQPLPSLLAWLGMRLFGSTFDAAQIPFILIASALPLVSFSVMFDLRGNRRQAWIAALLTVFSGFYLPFWTNTEAFSPFALTASLALLVMARARQSNRTWTWLAVGALSALGHLSRADGLLLLLVGLLIVLWPGRGVAFSLRATFLTLTGYLVVMAPWFVRNFAALGSPLPTGGIDTLFLVEYNDLFLFDRRPDLPTYLASGLGTILAGKWGALLVGLGTFVAVHNLIFLTPFTLIGWRRRWRDPTLLPALLYGLALYAAMTLAFTFPGARGGLFHSGGALLPFIFPVATLGLDDALAWIARRRPTWRPQAASRVFGPAFVAIAALLSAYLIVTRIVGISSPGIAWNRQDAVYAEIDAYLAGEDALVMSNNPPGFYYHTGRGGVPVPSGDEATLIAAARAYHIDYVVIDRNVVPALKPLYDDGPTSAALQLQATFRPADPVYLYHLTPD
jgi:4-amino-4-deoxy-L-arabinose transferase-like glycosyltransferase